MNIAVISYSLTGNNKALAQRVAQALQADLIEVTEPKARTMGTIMLDMLFNRTPQAKPGPASLDGYGLLLFCGPVWMGHVASPLRPYLQHLRKHPQQYGFFSISGGADGGNGKLAGELQKRAGAAPVMLLDQHIAGLLQAGTAPAPERKDTSAYRLTEKDAEVLADTVIQACRQAV
ncbi:MAG: hypothetical protein K0Q90_3394 [Paenibacillaceae bacterium]|jgi:flavodoxin|nr:hypothetical protein [Paenibacillaceae bacterium]